MNCQNNDCDGSIYEYIDEDIFTSQSSIRLFCNKCEKEHFIDNFDEICLLIE